MIGFRYSKWLELLYRIQDLLPSFFILLYIFISLNNLNNYQLLYFLMILYGVFGFVLIFIHQISYKEYKILKIPLNLCN